MVWGALAAAGAQAGLGYLAQEQQNKANAHQSHLQRNWDEKM